MHEQKANLASGATAEYLSKEKDLTELKKKLPPIGESVPVPVLAKGGSGHLALIKTPNSTYNFIIYSKINVYSNLRTTDPFPPLHLTSTL